MAINGATAHAFAHILYKGLLFMGAGAVLYTPGRSKLTELGGLARAMPLTLALFMVGAFSISGFPLFSGFVSKSMTVAAAELGGMGAVVLLLNLAAVGTFVCIGLKVPYFTWFGTNRSLKPTPTPLGMHVGMVLTSVICVAIGVYPALLYNLLPFAVDYQPYTTPYVLRTMQLLIGITLAFCLILKKLSAKATITLDTDCFYRKPSRLTYSLFVVSVCRLFGSVESLTHRFVESAIMLGANPPGYIIDAIRSVGHVLFPIGKSRGSVKPYKPGKYRRSLGVMVLVVLVCLVILLSWAFLKVII